MCLKIKKKKKKKDYSTQSSQVVSNPSTNRARRGLTSLIGREVVLSSWYGRNQYSFLLFYFLLHSLKKRKEKKKVFYTLSHTHILTLSFPFFVHLLCLIWKSLFFGDEKVKIRERIKKAQKKTLAQTKHNMAAHNEQMNDQTNKQTHRQTRVHVCMQPTKATQWKKRRCFPKKIIYFGQNIWF